MTVAIVELEKEPVILSEAKNLSVDHDAPLATSAPESNTLRLTLTQRQEILRAFHRLTQASQ